MRTLTIPDSSPPPGRQPGEQLSSSDDEDNFGYGSSTTSSSDDSDDGFAAMEGFELKDDTGRGVSSSSRLDATGGRSGVPSNSITPFAADDETNFQFAQMRDAVTGLDIEDSVGNLLGGGEPAGAPKDGKEVAAGLDNLLERSEDVGLDELGEELSRQLNPPPAIEIHREEENNEATAPEVSATEPSNDDNDNNATVGDFELPAAEVVEGEASDVAILRLVQRWYERPAENALQDYRCTLMKQQLSTAPGLAARLFAVSDNDSGSFSIDGLAWQLLATLPHLADWGASLASGDKKASQLIDFVHFALPGACEMLDASALTDITPAAHTAMRFIFMQRCPPQASAFAVKLLIDMDECLGWSSAVPYCLAAASNAAAFPAPVVEKVLSHGSSLAESGESTGALVDVCGWATSLVSFFVHLNTTYRDEAALQIESSGLFVSVEQQFLSAVEILEAVLGTEEGSAAFLAANGPAVATALSEAATAAAADEDLLSAFQEALQTQPLA